MADDLQGYLKSLPTDNGTRADAWDAVNGAKDQTDFQQRIGKLNIPNDAKADLWDSKYSGKALTTYRPPAQPTAASTPATASSPGALSRLWGWANEPINVGHLRDTIAQQKADSESAPTLAESEHPYLSAGRKALEGFGADTAKMLLTPLSGALAVTGGIGQGVGRVATVAKGVGALAGGAFAVHGGTDLAQNPLPKENESTSDYVRRAGGDAAMVLGGVGGMAKEVTDLRSSETSSTSATNPTPANTVGPTATTTSATARKASALGSPATPEVARTVHVDPAMADALHKFNQSDLPGKRVIVRNNKMQLANTDPTKTGFNYQNFKDEAGNPTIDTSVSDTPAEGKIPVELSTVSGGRGTSAPGHYLSNQILGELPSTEAATPPPAPAAKAEAQPPTEVAATPPAATENVLPETAEKPTPQVAETKPVPKGTLGAVRAKANRLYSQQASMHPDFTGQQLWDEVNGFLTDSEKGLLSARSELSTLDRDLSDKLDTASTPDEIAKHVADYKTSRNVQIPQDKVVVPADASKGIAEVKLPTMDPSPLPGDIAKSTPNYGYQGKNFKLNFEDPTDLAAYTVTQKTPNKAHGKFMDYLQSQGMSPEEAVDHGNNVRAAIKEQARTGDPAEGPLTVPKTPKATPMEKSPVADLGKPQAITPPTGSPELEDKLRPMLGQLIRTGQLRTGELASHAIDIAIRETRDPDGSIPPYVQASVSKILGEPVGKNLTGSQITALEQRRGATLGTEPQLKVFSNTQADILRNEGGRKPNGGRTTPDEEDEKFFQSQTRALEMLQDPNTSESLRKRLTDVIQSGKPFHLTQPENEPYLKYPGPVDLSADHPEAPFAPKALGSDIAPINTKNLIAALHPYRPRDLFLRTSKSSPHVSPEDLAHLEGLKTPLELNKAPQQGANDLEHKAVLSDLIGKVDEQGKRNGSISVEDASEEGIKRGSKAAEFERILRQKALDSFQAKTLGAAKGLIGEIKKAGGVRPGLRAQLDALSPGVKRLLPPELFNEKSATPDTPNADASPTVKEPAEAASAPKKPTSRPTPYDGIRTTGLEDELLKEFPNIGPKIDRIQQSVAESVPQTERQKFYKNALRAFADSKYVDDDFALAKGIDAVRSQEIKPDKSGGLGIATGSNQRPYTPHEAWAINQDVADKQLARWEDMSLAEIMKKKAGLWADSIQDRIDATAPFSDDPVENLAQLDAHNELLERHNALKAIVGRSDNLHDSLLDMWKNWTGRGIDAEAKEVAGRTLREVGGTMDRNNAIMRQSFDSLERFLNELPIHDQDRFWDNMTRGLAQPTDSFHPVDPDYIKSWEAKHGPVLDPNEVASRLRSVMDAARERVTATSGNLQNFFINYMPGLWENQAKGKAFTDNWVGNRNFQGDTHFLKQKMYEYYGDALKQGLQPTTTNPVRGAMMITEQMNRYSMAHEWKNTMMDNGITHFFQAEETPPIGWQKLDDKLFTNQGGGAYWAPSGVARMFNNFVSSGLRGKWKVPYTTFSMFDAIKSSNSLANSMQLGLSAFHGVETMLNSGFTTMALGLKQTINEGKMFSGIGNMLKGGTFITPLVEDTWNGAKGLMEYRDPGSTNSIQYAQLASDLESARANIITNPNFHIEALDRFKKNYALAEESLLPPVNRAKAGAKAAFNLLQSAVETTAWPLMNYLIPRVKIGAFYKMAQQIHTEYEGQPPETINREMQKAWDSIDNRFGQVSYQNMFMNKTVQDIATLAVRSPGWNIGTLREVGGGIKDAIQSGSNLVQGKGLKISNRTAYTGAMVIGTMMVNAMYHYIHTGQMAQGVDFFFPKDGTKTIQGEDNRVYPKTYVYDFVNLFHSPVQTVEHKAAPDISTLNDIIQNQDYYHKTIRDPGSSAPAQAASTLAYMAHQFVPFSFGNLQESQLRNQSSKWEPFAGILPAPRWVGRTSAENLAYEYYTDTKASGGQSPAMLDRQRQFVELRNKVASGQVTPDQIQEAVNSGKLLPGAVKHLYDSMSTPQILTWSKQVRDPEQLWNVWHVATPEEKKILFPTVLSRISKETTGQEQEDKLNDLQKFISTNPPE
jgi:hypothetical protein